MAHMPIAPLIDFETRIVSLLGPITETDVNIVVDLLLRLDALNAKEITVYISAQGGDMLQALKLLDTLRLLRSPVTAVGFGLVEGAALVFLAGCGRRILFPSTILSSAGLWALPEMHGDIRQPIGLHSGVDSRQQLLVKLREQSTRAFAVSPGKIPGLLGDPDQLPKIFSARESVEFGIADFVVTGPERRFIKPTSKPIPYVTTINRHLSN